MNLTKKASNLMQEREYRSLSNISYSMIKKFLESRQSFYREFILREPVDKKESVSLVMGSLIDCLVTDRENFDNKFAVASCTEPKGQMKDLVDNLYKRTIKCLDENGGVSCSMSELLEQAIHDTKYDYNNNEIAFKGKTFEKIVEMFEADGLMYYTEKRNNYGKTIVTIGQVEKAEQIANELKSNPFTAELINAKTEDTQEVFYQLAIVFKHNGIEMKSLIDKLIVNHEEGTIQPLDLKSTWETDNFSYSYTYHGYYLQAAMYDMALRYWRKENDIENYKVLPMKFIVCDSAGYMSSVVYSLTREDIQNAEKGFSIRGKYYTGLQEAITDIAFNIESSRWNVSREAMQNNGQMVLDITYDKC